MDLEKFEKFNQECSEKLPSVIDKILKAAKGEKVCAIGFMGLYSDC